MNRHAGPDSTGRCEHPIMAKPEVRRALTCAVPHEDTHKKVYFGGGHVIKTITPRICPNSTDKFWPYHENLEMAKMLLAEAGYPDGFDMTISYDKAISEMEETCTLIKSNFEKIRIRVQLQGLPSAVYSDTKFSRKQMAHCDNFRPDYAQSSGWGDRFPGSAGFQPAGGPCGLEDAQASRFSCTLVSGLGSRALKPDRTGPRLMDCRHDHLAIDFASSSQLLATLVPPGIASLGYWRQGGGSRDSVTIRAP